VVSGREQLIVEDARVHPVLKSNLAIKDLGVIAYAGVPVSTAGETLGSLCAIDSKPRTWSGEDLETLHDLAQVIEASITLRQAGPGATAKAAAGLESTQVLQACGSALMGLTRLLHRHGARLEGARRAEVLDAIRQRGRQLVELAG
jgi:GAF domain-containing protein